MKTGNFFEGIKDAGKAWTAFGTAMTACEGMDGDIAAIEAWAQIFTKPERLATVVAEHWVFHGKQIKADVAQETSDWSAGQYFDAGKDTGAALSLAVGPMYENEVANLNLKPEEEFVSGLLWGLVQDEHLGEVQACVVDAKSVVDGVESLAENVQKGWFISAAGDVKDIAHNFSNMLSTSGDDCMHMTKDVDAIKKWADRGWLILVETLAGDMLWHRHEIEADVHTIGADWNSGDYSNSGKALADLLTVALGEIETGDDSSVESVEAFLQ